MGVISFSVFDSVDIPGAWGKFEHMGSLFFSIGGFHFYRWLFSGSLLRIYREETFGIFK